MASTKRIVAGILVAVSTWSLGGCHHDMGPTLPSEASVPTLYYWGTLEDDFGNAPPDGQYLLSFRFYDSKDAREPRDVVEWQQTTLRGGQGTPCIPVQGVRSASFDAARRVYLEVVARRDADELIQRWHSPRIQLDPVGHALRASSVARDAQLEFVRGVVASNVVIQGKDLPQEADGDALKVLGRANASSLRVQGQSDLQGVSAKSVSTGVIEILGGDLAEKFVVHDAPDGTQARPGSLVSISREHPGDLVVTSSATDDSVVGVVSGANGLNAGVVLRAAGVSSGAVEHNVGLVGRVWTYVDASVGAIKPGDRLGPSTTPGYAVAVPAGSSGGFGRALTGLSAGKGLVLVLIVPH